MNKKLDVNRKVRLTKFGEEKFKQHSDMKSGKEYYIVSYGSENFPFVINGTFVGMTQYGFSSPIDREPSFENVPEGTISYKKLDINREVRLTEFGRRYLISIYGLDTDFTYRLFVNKDSDIYPLKLSVFVTMTECGRINIHDREPSFENVPEISGSFENVPSDYSKITYDINQLKLDMERLKYTVKKIEATNIIGTAEFISKPKRYIVKRGDLYLVRVLSYSDGEFEYTNTLSKALVLYEDSKVLKEFKRSTCHTLEEVK